MAATLDQITHFRTVITNSLFLLLGAWGIFLSLDPSGIYFGTKISAQYFAALLICTVGAWSSVMFNRRQWDVILLFAATAITAIGLLRLEWTQESLADSSIRIILIPYIITCAYVASSGASRAGKYFQLMVTAGGIVVGVSIIAWRLLGYKSDFFQIYHEEVFLLAPLMLIDAKRRGRLLTLLGFSLGLFALLLSNKFTGFIVLAVVLLLRLAQLHSSRFLYKRANSLWTVLFSMSAVLLAIFCVLYLLTSSDAPTGSTEVRYFTYLIRWDQFIHSPFFGEAHRTTELFVPDKNFYIPSHSDLLDVLAFTGIVGAAFLLIPLVSTLRLSLRSRNYVWAALISCITLTFLVNPLLYQPTYLIVLAAVVYFSRIYAHDYRSDG
ncbi:O-antigen ligase family protein [Pseudoxanthomonas suwonensis]|uniref:O-antigen ligase family protein n=1 Tax=Pseudoxanthomonas suwonensis TaxID=314722 RepID=UPI00118587E4|nr:O-antigen ligase family protein [Pseudoxanthomonas suwonensis]